MTVNNPGRVSKAWLLAQLAGCALLTAESWAQAFAYVQVLQQLTGQTWRLDRGRWIALPAPPESREFAVWQIEEGARHGQH